MQAPDLPPAIAGHVQHTIVKASERRPVTHTQACDPSPRAQRVTQCLAVRIQTTGALIQDGKRRPENARKRINQ